MKVRIGKIEKIYIPRIEKAIDKAGYLFGSIRSLSNLLKIPPSSFRDTLNMLRKSGTLRVERVYQKKGRYSYLLICRNGFYKDYKDLKDFKASVKK